MEAHYLIHNTCGLESSSDKGSRQRDGVPSFSATGFCKLRLGWRWLVSTYVRLPECEMGEDRDHFTHDLASPSCMISSRNMMEHGFIPSRQPSSHCCSIARRTLSLLALSSSISFHSALADKSEAAWSSAIFDSISLCTVSVLWGPMSRGRLFNGRILRSASGDDCSGTLDRCFLRAGLR